MENRTVPLAIQSGMRELSSMTMGPLTPKFVNSISPKRSSAFSPFTVTVRRTLRRL